MNLDMRKLGTKEGTIDFIRSLPVGALAIYFKSVSEQDKTFDYDVYTLGCQLNPYCYEHVPKKFKTRRLSYRTVDQMPSMIRFVPERHIDAEFAWMAAGHDGQCLAFIPKALHTPKLLERAIYSNDLAWLHIVFPTPEALTDLSIIKQWNAYLHVTAGDVLLFDNQAVTQLETCFKELLLRPLMKTMAETMKDPQWSDQMLVMQEHMERLAISWPPFKEALIEHSRSLKLSSQNTKWIDTHHTL